MQKLIRIQANLLSKGVEVDQTIPLEGHNRKTRKKAMAEKSHGSNAVPALLFSEKMSQMSHLADATIVLDDGSTFKVFRLLLALGSEVRSILLCFAF